MKFFSLLLFVFTWGVFQHPAGAATKIPIPGCGDFKAVLKAGPPARQFARFLDIQWKHAMLESPEGATYVGYPGQDDRWTDYSPEAFDRRRRIMHCQHDVLKKIKRSALKGQDRVNYDLALYNIELDVEGDQFGGEFMPINHMGGFHSYAPMLFRAMPAQTKAHFENMLTRLDRFPPVVRQQMTLMREGVKRKLMPYKDFMGTITQQIDALIPANVDESPFFTAFKDIKADLPEAEKTQIQERARTAIKTKIYPALAEFREFFVKEYAPHGRADIAWTKMPNGEKWYAIMVKAMTTTAKTPDELHEIGLKEVERLTAEMEKVKEQVKFKGDLRAFNKHLLSDKRFFFKTEEELLAAYRDITKRLDPELPRLFGTLPRLPYGVRAIPAFEAKSFAAARYIGGSLEAGRAGYFEANTHDLKSRPKWEMETLAIHEAVPGHHLQIALAKELKGLPEFRRNGGYAAFSEGWALYAETLGKEMGFYKDPYSYYGHLGADIWRAVRLVVDTGMHAKGWSREQALEYFRSKVPSSELDSANEINRYITWPGQALAYKVGQMKFRELRERATAKLGDRFDIRDFHDEVLRHGGLPLDVLEKTVDEWIVARAKGSKASATAVR